VRQCKYKLQDGCSNNQAEQIEILKSLELLPTLENNSRMVAIYTDSKVTLASLQNNSIHSFLTEEIRKMVRHLTSLTFKNRASYIYRTGVPLPSRCYILYIFFNKYKYCVS